MECVLFISILIARKTDIDIVDEHLQATLRRSSFEKPVQPKISLVKILSMN